MGVATIVTVASTQPSIHHTLELTSATVHVGDVTSVSPAPPNVHSLRAQLQPFPENSPQQVQEQMQRLNIQQGEPEVFVSKHGATVTTGFLENSLAHPTSNGETLTASGSCSSIASSDISSRRGSTGSRSMLEQLLSQTPPANPIPSPQSQGVSTSSSNSLYSRSPPFQAEPHLHPLMARRLSNPYEPRVQPLRTSENHSARQQRYTLPNLYPHALLDHMAQQNAYNPSFPVTMHPRRETSPTKSAYSSSPTTASNLGRRSPIHEVQMDSIAEDTTECTSNDKMNPSSPSSYSPVGSPRNSRVQGDNKRQRKTGMSITNPSIQAHIANSFQPNGKPAFRRNSYPKQHHYIDTALHMPPFPQPRNVTSPPHTQTPTTTNAHTELLNHYNTAYQGGLSNVPAVGLPQGGLTGMLGRISMVLANCGIPYHQHSNGIFAVEHQGVKLQILVGTLPHLATPSAIQLQYIAGDTHTYETLCTHLASRLQFVAQ